MTTSGPNCVIPAFPSLKESKRKSYYGNYGNYGSLTEDAISGNDLYYTPNIYTYYDYLWNDNISTGGSVPTGTYIVNRLADKNVKDQHFTTQQCSNHRYDGMAHVTGQQSGLTRGLQTEQDGQPNCQNTTGIAQPQTVYDPWGNAIATKDADAVAGISGHTGCTQGSTAYTTCTALDPTTEALPVSASNALNQTGTTSYGSAAGGTEQGWWATSAVDANGQTTSTSYDALGRAIQTVAPGEANGWTTQTSYTIWCGYTGSNPPCLEVDATQRVDASSTVTRRSFYDGFGRLVETRTPAPGGQDVIQYARYDNAGREGFQSLPYYVTAYTGAPGASAFATPTGSETGTVSQYNHLNQVVQSSDATSATNTISCNNAQLADGACYAAKNLVDANGHQTTTYSNAMGQDLYQQDWTGTSGSYTSYRVVRLLYDVLGDQFKTEFADTTHGVTKTMNGMQQVISTQDANTGTTSYNVRSQRQPDQPGGCAGHQWNSILWL